MAPALSRARSKPKARPYVAGVVASVIRTFRTGVRIPRPSQPPTRPRSTCHHWVARAKLAIPEAVMK
jgi:hypothetical protein